MPDIEYEKKWGKGPHLTVDACVCHINRRTNVLHLLLIRRKDNGLLAIPGGFVNPGERLEAAARRECYEETGLKECGELIAIHIPDDPERDPRSHIVTIVHLFELFSHSLPEVVGGDDALSADWYRLSDPLLSPETMYADHYKTLTKLFW